MLKRLIVPLIASIVLVAGCGFHLRGQLPLSDTLSVIAVKSDDPELRVVMVEALKTSGATVVESAETATALLELTNVKYERRVRTIDTRGKVNGYTLVYSVSFRVTNAEGAELRKSGPMQTTREYSFDSTQVLQKEDEELELKRDMEKDLTQRIMRQLTTIAGLAPPRRA